VDWRPHERADRRLSTLMSAGATNLRRYVERFGPGRLDLELAGLCDAAEQDFVWHM
jgi:hypothetical protein